MQVEVVTGDYYLNSVSSCSSSACFDEDFYSSAISLINVRRQGMRISSMSMHAFRRFALGVELAVS